MVLFIKTSSIREGTGLREKKTSSVFLHVDLNYLHGIQVEIFTRSGGEKFRMKIDI